MSFYTCWFLWPTTMLETHSSWNSPYSCRLSYSRVHTGRRRTYSGPVTGTRPWPKRKTCPSTTRAKEILKSPYQPWSYVFSTFQLGCKSHVPSCGSTWGGDQLAALIPFAVRLALVAALITTPAFSCGKTIKPLLVILSPLTPRGYRNHQHLCNKSELQRQENHPLGGLTLILNKPLSPSFWSYRHIGVYKLDFFSFRAIYFPGTGLWEGLSSLLGGVYLQGAEWVVKGVSDNGGQCGSGA